MRPLSRLRAWRVGVIRPKWHYAMVGEIVRVELPPFPKPRSWSENFYRSSRMGRPRERVELQWRRHETPGTRWRNIFRILKAGRERGASSTR